MRRSVIGQAALLSLVLSGLLAPGSRGDDVYLKNGRSFEGVIVTSHGEEQVRITVLIDIGIHQTMSGKPQITVPTRPATTGGRASVSAKASAQSTVTPSFGVALRPLRTAIRPATSCHSAPGKRRCTASWTAASARRTRTSKRQERLRCSGFGAGPGRDPADAVTWHRRV